MPGHGDRGRDRQAARPRAAHPTAPPRAPRRRHHPPRPGRAYLARPELSLSKIAYLLGYTEQPSFHRAFRRWHDTTPTAYRASLTAAGR
ncbi:MAG: helix-turn-helix domain-containing protein [Myxococcota bacterium]|nr:helix-turn-helix domain-containing protein [Myxococcota bacterium]